MWIFKKSSTPLKTKEKQDEVDSFLESMARTIRNIPVRKRVKVNFKIHSIVHDCSPASLQWWQHLTDSPWMNVRIWPPPGWWHPTHLTCNQWTANPLSAANRKSTFTDSSETGCTYFQGLQTYTQFLNDQWTWKQQGRPCHVELLEL